MRHYTFFISIAFLIATSHSVFANIFAKTITREYPVPGHDLLVLEIPELWNVTYYEPAVRQAPIIIFYPREKPHAFQLTISPLWDDGFLRDVTDPVFIKEYLEAVGTEILAYSDEQNLVLVPLTGKAGSGYYFQLSDGSAPQEEYKFLMQGALAIDEILLVFSYFSNEANDKTSETILNYGTRCNTEPPT